MPDLIPVLLPRKEVQQRLVMARQTAKTARTLAVGVAQFGPKSQRSAAKIAKYTEQAEENEAIAASCVLGLKGMTLTDDDTAITVEVDYTPGNSEELLDPDPVSELAVMSGSGVDEEGG